MKKLFYTLILCFFALNLSAQVYFVSQNQVQNIYTGMSEVSYEAIAAPAGYNYAYKIDYASIEENYISIDFTNGDYLDGEVSNNNIYTHATNSSEQLVLLYLSIVDYSRVTVSLPNNINASLLAHIQTDAAVYSSSVNGKTKTFNICKFFNSTGVNIIAPKFITESFEPHTTNTTKIKYQISDNENHNITINARHYSTSGGYYQLSFTETKNIEISKTSSESRAISTTYYNDANFGSISYSITYSNSEVADWIWISSPFDANITVQTTTGISLKLTYTNDPNQNYKNASFLLRKFDTNKRAQGKLDYWTEVKEAKLTAGEGYLLGIDPRNLTSNFVVTYTSVNSSNTNNATDQRLFSPSSYVSDYSNQHFIGTKMYYPAKVVNQSNSSVFYIAKQKDDNYAYFLGAGATSTQTLEPFTPFFIKFESGYISFQKNQSSANAPAARIQAENNTNDFLETYTININGTEWSGETTVLINPEKPENENGFIYFTENVSGIPFANQFYSLDQNKPRSFNYQTKEDQTIALEGRLQNEGEYTISLNGINTTANSVLLTDNTTGATTELTNNDYTFTANNEEILTGRFFLTFSFVPETTTDLYVAEANQIIVFGNANNCTIKNLTIGKNVVIYDATGHLVYNQIAQSDIININIPMGTYIVKQSNKTARFAIK